MKQWSWLLLLAAPAALRTAPQKPCLIELISEDRNVVSNQLFGQNRTYDAAGHVHMRCSNHRTVLLDADSVSILSDSYARMYGHVVYNDSDYRYSADTMIYNTRLEKLEARGNVHALDKKAGSTLAGPYVDYWRQVKGINDSAKVVAVQHPEVRYKIRNALGDTAGISPYILRGERLTGFGESQLNGWGNVTIDRDSLHGDGDSLEFRRGKSSVGELWGAPAVLRRRGADSFDVVGREIRINQTDDHIHDVRSFLKARVRRGEADVAGDTVLLDFANDKVALTTAWKRDSGATLHSAGYDVHADSVVIMSPDELLKEIRAFRRASLSTPHDSTMPVLYPPAGDSTPPLLTRDTLWGNRLVAKFVQIDSAGSTVTRVDGLQSFGKARSLSGRMGTKNGKPSPTLNYTTADTIVIVMVSAGDSAGVRQIRAKGNVFGVEAETASLRPRKDTTKAGRPGGGR